MIRLFDNKYVDVGWACWTTTIADSMWREVIADKPVKISPAKFVQGDVRYCPAFNNYYKNTYAITMPFDISLVKFENKIRLNPKTTIHCHPSKLDSIITIVDNDAEDRVTVQIQLNNVFISDTPHTIIETMPPVLHGCKEEIIYTNGRFDCHAWQRPLQFGFQIPKETLDQMDDETSIDFKKDEVVMYVRINTPNDKAVKLYAMDHEDIEHMSKYALRNVTLPTMIRRFNFAQVIERVRNRRPKKFLRNKQYDKGD